MWIADDSCCAGEEITRLHKKNAYLSSCDI